MRFPQVKTLKEIADFLGIDFVGPEDFPVSGMNEIHVVEPGDIVFVDHPKYYEKALNSRASIVLINKKVDCPEGKALLISDDPFEDFNKLTNHFKPFRPSNSAISDSVEIGDGTIIQPNCFIGHHVKIGKNCLIHSNVSIYDDTIIGDNVVIHAGTVLGASAFYYKNRPDYYDQLQSGGNVRIEDNVHIGAACTIDRGVTASTIIGKGSKLDNQIQIGHDTIIGKKCLIAAQTGIAGCVLVEDECIIWGQVGIKSDVTIKKHTQIFAQSGINATTESGKTYYGTPAVEARSYFKQMVYNKQIPELLKHIKKK